jgi:hypothetical protein
VADRALFHLDNCYKWPSLRARGRIVRTHQASHTAFRGFGGPQVGRRSTWVAYPRVGWGLVSRSSDTQTVSHGFWRVWTVT